jgi:hypothetical protein
MLSPFFYEAGTVRGTGENNFNARKKSLTLFSKNVYSALDFVRNRAHCVLRFNPTKEVKVNEKADFSGTLSVPGRCYGRRLQEKRRSSGPGSGPG